MKIIQNCRNPKCLAKKSMVSVTTKKYYSYIPNGRDKSYRTHTNEVAFYICRKCGFMNYFKSRDIQEGGMFSICLVPKDDESKIDKIKSMKKPSCVYCGLSTFPADPQKKEITQNNIIKLWLKGKFFGYYCKVHRLAFCKKIEEVNWNNIDKNYQGTGTFNVLEPLNSIISRYTHKEYKKDKDDKFILDEEGKKIRISVLKLTKNSIPEISSKAEKFDEDKGLLIEYVEFKKIGGFPTTSGPSEPSNNSQYVSVLVPQNKMNKFKKCLEKHDCKIT